MKSIFLRGESRQGLLSLDPRTKLFILLLGNITVLLSPSLLYELVMTLLIVLLGLLCGVYEYSIKMTVVYCCMVAIQMLGSLYLDNGLCIFLVTFVVFLRKVFPCAMLGGIVIATTRVNEFMAAMHKLHMPRSLVIPLAVSLRYFPMVQEEWGHSKDAMQMRGLSTSLWDFFKKPLKTMEWVYVPLMISAAKIADELAAAAVTRGIDNPKPRTCVQPLGYGVIDGVCAMCFVILLLIVVLEVRRW